MGVQSYTAKDLSLESPSNKLLLEGAENEARTTPIKLSDYVGKIPANLTPTMASWYQQIASDRGAALDEVAAAYEVTDPETGAQGVFLKRELDTIKDGLLEKKRGAEQEFRHNNQNLFSQLETAKADYSGKKRRYAELVSRHNREAKPTPKWYWLALLVIGLAEILINYESFSSVRAFSPAIATGTTLLVALALAFSSHLYGTFMAQYRARFGPHADDSDRGVAFRMLGLGTLCLAVVLGLVWYARTSYFADIITENELIGGKAPSALAVIGGSMSANLLVWIVGVIIAFLCHDEDYRFPVALRERDRAEKTLLNAQNKVSKPLQRSYEKLTAEAENSVQQAESRELAFAHTSAQKVAKDLLAKVEAQDAQVISVLLNYRTRLIPCAQETNVQFEKYTELRAEETTTLTPAQYASEPIHLKYM